jgi:hypothetical protein
MCRPASFYLTRENIYWSKTSDSHTDIIREFNLREDDSRNAPSGVRIEVSPPGGNLSLPLADWVYEVDQDRTPAWYDSVDGENRARRALSDWARHKLSCINLAEAFNPSHPFHVKRPRAMTKKRAIALCREWESVRASVGESVGESVRASVWASVGESVGESVWASVGASVGESVRASVWESVRASVWASVRAYAGSLFTLPAWKYTSSPNPWAPLRELWTNGLVPSFDGKTWRLHEGPDAKVFAQFDV